LDEVVVRGCENLSEEISAIEKQVESERVTRLVLEQLPAPVSPFARQVVQQSLRCAREPCRVNALASDLGLPRRTLAQKLERSGMPSPSALLSWSRLIHAASCLQSPACSIESVGLALGFGSGTGLRNMLRRYSGLCCTEVRSFSGLLHLIVLFCATIQP
jgi:transcriptional regulator GlxA family with amidase domain